MPKRARSEKRIRYDRERQRRLRKEKPEVARRWSAKSYVKHRSKRLAQQKKYYRTIAPQRSKRAAKKYKSMSSEERKAYLEMSRRSKLKRRYGLTVEQYDAMLTNQNGVCAICCRPEEHKGYVRLSVDHDHKTGKIRGLLCRRCNSMLANSGDDPAMLIKGARYLTLSA